MKLFTTTTDYMETIKAALPEGGEYIDPVTFHCYWNGTLNEKHFYSILSCYFFNVHSLRKNKIVLWLENNTPNHYNTEIGKYADIHYFSLFDEFSDVKQLCPPVHPKTFHGFSHG